jgi:hypothetical protein
MQIIWVLCAACNVVLLIMNGRTLRRLAAARRHLLEAQERLARALADFQEVAAFHAAVVVPVANDETGSA